MWARAWRSVPPNVWALGATSLFTDLSSEMVASVLPIYLVVQLGFSPLAFGTLDGLYNGLGALARLASGPAVDRWRRHKEVAAGGYGVSALCRLGLLAAGRWWPGVAGAIALDRVAKGIRTVPRDALIADSAPAHSLGYAFGVHRALDACGAVLGPVAAFALLAAVPQGFDVVFVASFFAALIGLAVLLLFVENVRPSQRRVAGTSDRPDRSLARPRVSPGRGGGLRPFRGDHQRRVRVPDSARAARVHRRASSRCSTSARRCRTWRWPCRRARWPTGGGVGGCSSRATARCSACTGSS